MAGNQGKLANTWVSFHNAGSRGCGSLTLGMELRFISALGPIHRGWPMTLSSLSFHLQMTWLCGGNRVNRWNYRTDTKRIWVLRLSLLSQIVRRGVGQTLWMPVCSPIGWVPWQLCWQPPESAMKAWQVRYTKVLAKCSGGTAHSSQEPTQSWVPSYEVTAPSLILHIPDHPFLLFLHSI